MTRKPPSNRELGWARRLAEGDREGAWDRFLDSHRNLIFATIGRLIMDRESRMDAFALVCEKLRQDDFRRLRRFRPEGPAQFSTWLVTVVRNLVIDWYRQTSGRRQSPSALEHLSDVQRAIFQRLAGTGLSYAEAYESLRAEGVFEGEFGTFLRAVRELHREVEAQAGSLVRELVGVDPVVELDSGPVLPDEGRIDYGAALAALETLPADVRVATLLFVVDEVPADEVARIVGWPNRKAVYNRVRRALVALRSRLEDRDERAGPVTPEQSEAADP